jgi:hypothetical protein
MLECVKVTNVGFSMAMLQLSFVVFDSTKRNKLVD